MNIPRPEYPRPQLERKDWINLNGEWEFAFDDKDEGLEDRWNEDKDFPLKITVPFAYQTKLSGINDKSIHEIVWYGRDISVPDDWKDCDILLHFGAVDYSSTVWINGKEVGHNQGGHVPFSFDISPYLREKGNNRLVVRVEDCQSPFQPRGKQSTEGLSKGIDYYCTTGIWQTVWLERAPQMRIDEIKLTPFLDVSGLEIVAFLHAPSIGWRLEADIFDGETLVAGGKINTHNATARLMIKIPEPKTWFPKSPHLYNITLRLYHDNKQCDEVKTYTGLRSIKFDRGKMIINGQPTFMMMVLDQGYWPDGLMTAPTDEDYKKDILLAKKLGFNGVRKHQKIEDPRWLYWCDRLGLFVWGEMANAREWSVRTEEKFISEWERAVRRDYNHPSIVAWVPNNESWGYPGIREEHYGQYDFVERVVSITRRVDSTRPVIDNDGWEHTDVGDICAIHDYTSSSELLVERYEPAMKKGSLPEISWLMEKPLFIRGSKYRGQPIMLTEIGGFLTMPPGASKEQLDTLYDDYGSISSPEELTEKYADLMSGVEKLSFISGVCYTQLVDVEQEMNGLLTHDRRLKVDPEKIYSSNQELISTYIKRFRPLR